MATLRAADSILDRGDVPRASKVETAAHHEVALWNQALL